MPTVQANGINIFYETHGQGEPLLIIAGLGLDLTQVEAIAVDLSDKRKVITFDNRGVGRSDKPDAPYSIDMMVEDAAQFLDAIGVEMSDVLGISLGGRIALSLALEHPEKVRSLILASTSARMNNQGGLLWSLSDFLLRIPFVRGIGTKYPQPYFAYVRQRDASVGYDVTDRLHCITARTLILHGKKDRFAPFQLAEEMHDRIKGSELVVFDGGHLFVFSKRREFTSSIGGFLEDRPSK